MAKARCRRRWPPSGLPRAVGRTALGLARCELRWRGTGIVLAANAPLCKARRAADGVEHETDVGFERFRRVLVSIRKKLLVSPQQPCDVARQVSRCEQVQNTSRAPRSHGMRSRIVGPKPSDRTEDTLWGGRGPTAAKERFARRRFASHYHQVLAMCQQRLEPQRPLGFIRDDGGAGEHLGREASLIAVTVQFDNATVAPMLLQAHWRPQQRLLLAFLVLCARVAAAAVGRPQLL